MARFSKDGQTFDVPDDYDTATGENRTVAKAAAKGYTQVVEVSKDGKDTYHIPAQDLKKAQEKGYSVYTEPSKMPQSKYTPEQSQMVGFAKGANFQGLDEVIGFNASPSGAAKTLANHFGANFKDKDVNTYKVNRDVIREEGESSARQNPGRDILGQLGAGVVQSAVAAPVAVMNSLKNVDNLSKGAKALLAAKTAAKVGAVQGGLEGVGSSTATNGKQLARDTGTGVVTGGIVGGLIGGASQGFKELLTGSSIDNFANLATEKAMRVTAEQKNSAGLREPGKFERMLRSVRDNALKPFQGQESLRESISREQLKANQGLDDVLSKIGNESVEGHMVAQNILNRADEAGGLAGTVDYAKKLNKSANDVYNVTANKTLNVKDAVKQKNSYNDAARYNSVVDPEKSIVAREGRNAWLQEIDKVAEPKLAELGHNTTYKQSREAVGNLIGADDIVQKSLANPKTAESFLSPAGIKHLVQNYGNQSAAYFADRIYKNPKYIEFLAKAGDKGQIPALNFLIQNVIPKEPNNNGR